MFLSNIHTHTFYSDGKSNAEDYVKSAIEKGFVSFGFSDHSPVVVAPEYHRSVAFDHHLFNETYPDYVKEIRGLQEKYKDDIEIYVGIEEDYYPTVQREGLDFVIGAVHFLQSPTTGTYHMPDYTVEEFEEACKSFGSVECFVTAYYKRLHWIVTQQAPDVLAHLDLITKLNKDNYFFNTSDSWYRALVTTVVDALEKTDIIVEMNSGAISRGYTQQPYPELSIMRELCKRGIPITISSDAHHVDALDCAFPAMVAIAKDVGYNTAKQLRGGAFRDTSL